MNNKDFRRLKRSELVDIIHELQEGKTENPEIQQAVEAVESEHRKLNKKRKIKKFILNTFSVLTVVAAVAVLISTFFFPIIQISGESMESTLHDGDIMLLFKTDNYVSGELYCVSWQNKLLLKRIIGVPGDVVEIDSKGNVFLNNEYLDEPYVKSKSLGECDITFPYTVPENKYFILGDSRESSIDSRSSVIGCVDGEQIVGKIILKIWSSKSK